MNNKTIKESISKQIQKYLNDTKMSKTSLSELLGVTRTSINRWINCICAPDIELFPRLCEVLNISIFELLGLSIEDHFSTNEVEILNMYYNNMNFRHLIDRYRSDKTFRNELDKVLDS